jgi:hypothetical protein
VDERPRRHESHELVAHDGPLPAMCVHHQYSTHTPV